MYVNGEVAGQGAARRVDATSVLYFHTIRYSYAFVRQRIEYELNVCEIVIRIQCMTVTDDVRARRCIYCTRTYPPIIRDVFGEQTHTLVDCKF